MEIRALRSYHYLIYGLGVHSDIPLLGTPAAACPVDVRIRWSIEGSRDPGIPQEDRDGVGASPQDIRLHWAHAGEMIVRGGCEIHLITPPTAEIGILRHLVNGVGLGLVLHQRGIATLHASAASICGVTVAFAGPKGAGKSTLAAALMARGHALVSDDVVAIDFTAAGVPEVRVGAPSLNLWPDAAVATGLDPSELPLIWSRSPKRVRLIRKGTRPIRARLGFVAFLAETADTRVPTLEWLRPVDAFRHVAANAHAQAWLGGADSCSISLHQCGRLISSIPMARLTRTSSLADLPLALRLVEEVVDRWDECNWSDRGRPANDVANDASARCDRRTQRHPAVGGLNRQAH